MGIEYRLKFAFRGREDVEQLLSRMQDARAANAPSTGFEFGQMAMQGEMPDATASAEPYGLHFCDHGGLGRAYLGHVVAKLVGQYGPVQVAELE